MADHVLVLAGTLEEYRDWAVLEDGLHVYVADAMTPQGLDVGSVVEVGTFDGRRDAARLRAAAEGALATTRRRREEKDREAREREEAEAGAVGLQAGPGA